MTNANDCSVRRPGRPAASRSWRARVAWLAAGASLLAFAAFAAPQEGDEPDTTDLVGALTLPGSAEVLPAPARPVRPGESLRFSVRYGIISAGDAWLEVPEVRDWSGRPVYTLVARAESNRFFSAFYKVRNRIESYWDSSGYFSRRFHENRREGGYRANNEIIFDYERGEARYSDGQAIPIPPQVQDALSSFYFTRTQALPLGGSVIFDYHASHKSQPLEVKVLGRQRVDTPAGAFDCVVIEPILKAGGIFKNRGRLVIWLTADDRRMPVMMKSKVTIGSISVILTEVKTG